MNRRGGSAGAALLLLVALLVAAPTASGDDASISDGDDIGERDALDIRYVGLDHRSTRRFTYSITTYDPFTLADLDPDAGNFGIAIDTDGDLDDLERIVYVFTYRKLRGAVTNGAGRRLIARAHAERRGNRTVEVSFERRDLGSGVTSYRWFAFALTQGAGRCCFDTAPNRKWIWHDIAKPSASILGFGNEGNQSVPGTTIPVSFEVSDVGGQGQVAWSLRLREDGRGAWTEIASGTGSGLQEVPISVSDGSAWQVCAVANDDAGNRAWETEGVSVPMDDQGFGFTGAWNTAESDPSDFQGTRHVSSAAGDSFTFQVPAGFGAVWILPGGYDGIGRVTVNGQDVGTVTGSQYSGFRQFVPAFPDVYFSLPTNTVEVVVESGTLAIDGFAGSPAFAPDPANGCKL
jgi:hypothetical protein